MSLYYLDASAWVKRYVQEAGSDWVRRLWRERPRISCSSIGGLEVLSAILRRSHPGDPKTDAVAAEVSADLRGFYEVTVSPAVLLKAQQFIGQYRLRCADAIHLASAFLAGQELKSPVYLIASDAELLAAAQSEGFATLDPQADPALPPSA